MELSGKEFLVPTAECAVAPPTPYRARVVRRHRDFGYWECVYQSGGHPARHGQIAIHSTDDIRSHLVA